MNIRSISRTIALVAITVLTASCGKEPEPRNLEPMWVNDMDAPMTVSLHFNETWGQNRPDIDNRVINPGDSLVLPALQYSAHYLCGTAHWDIAEMQAANQYFHTTEVEVSCKEMSYNSKTGYGMSFTNGEEYTKRNNFTYHFTEASFGESILYNMYWVNKLDEAIKVKVICPKDLGIVAVEETEVAAGDTICLFRTDNNSEIEDARNALFQFTETMKAEVEYKGEKYTSHYPDEAENIGYYKFVYGLGYIYELKEISIFEKK